MSYLILYILVATVVTAICQKRVYVGYPLDDYSAPPRMALSVVTGVFWPVALLIVLPVYLIYKLTAKVLDKSTKV